MGSQARSIQKKRGGQMHQKPSLHKATFILVDDRDDMRKLLFEAEIGALKIRVYFQDTHPGCIAGWSARSAGRGSPGRPYAGAKGSACRRGRGHCFPRAEHSDT
ncbi:hypothetical protein BDW71DRAFT_172258 [Aspergillus fruticulosus]